MDALIEFAKKNGMSATLAVIVVSLVVGLPAAFAIDARYARSEDVSKIDARIDNLADQVNRMAGQEELLITIMANRATAMPAPSSHLNNDVRDRITDLQQQNKDIQSQLSQLRNAKK